MSNEGERTARHDGLPVTMVEGVRFWGYRAYIPYGPFPRNGITW